MTGGDAVLRQIGIYALACPLHCSPSTDRRARSDASVPNPTVKECTMLTLTRRPTRMLDDVIFRGWPFGQDTDGTLTSNWIPAVDVFEDTDAVRIAVEVPGVNPDNITISLEQNVLTISGEKQQVSEEKTERVHRYERAYGSFSRSFTLPSTVDADRIDANTENGVLSVVIPKAEKAKPRQIQVKTAGK
jgi:HSP20 family protein